MWFLSILSILCEKTQVILLILIDILRPCNKTHRFNPHIMCFGVAVSRSPSYHPRLIIPDEKLVDLSRGHREGQVVLHKVSISAMADWLGISLGFLR